MLVDDCNGLSGDAPGVVLRSSSSDAASRTVYAANERTFDPRLTATSGIGVGVVFNAPAGAATVTAVVAATGRTIASARVIVRAGALSETMLSPGLRVPSP